MRNHIENSGYALGISIPPALQNKKVQSDKDKKKLNKFREILLSVLPETKAASESDILEQLETLSQEEAIALLQDTVRSAGDALRIRQNPETILAYKKAVKHFIGYVTKEAYTVTTKTHVGRDKSNHLQAKAFTQIVIINEKLDKFAAELLYDQKTQLFILERVEEIYGLLIDLIT